MEPIGSRPAGYQVFASNTLSGASGEAVAWRVSKTYDTVFDLTPEDFDITFREYAVQRFGQGAH